MPNRTGVRGPRFQDLGMHESVQTALVKIVRANIHACNIERQKYMGLHMDHAVLVLQRSLNAQKAVAGHDRAVALEYIGRQNDIGDARLVFE